MAFYFALLNVSKKDPKEEKQSSSSSHHRRHRRHSIASVESPLLDYRLLPRPQLLSDDVVITNDLAHQLESTSGQSPNQHPRLSDRRSRGSARASKWVQDNHNGQHQNASGLAHQSGHRSLHPPSQREPGPSSSRPPETEPPPLSRSKRMAFPGKEEDKKEDEKVAKKRGGRAKIEERKRGEQRQSEEEEEGKQKQRIRGGRGRKNDGGGGNGEDESGKEERKINKMRMEGSSGQVGQKKEDVSGRKKEPVKAMRRAPKFQPPLAHPAGVSTSPNNLCKSQSMVPVSKPRELLHPPIKFGAPVAVITSSSSSNINFNRHYSPKTRPDHPIRSSVFQVMAGSSATDESGRSSSQMSNESITPRRDDSPASSCCGDQKEQEVTMKLSAISMSSRASEPRLKKVTFESSPYVISNSFLGDGAGKVLVVRRGSGTAVRRVGALSNGAVWNHQSKTMTSSVGVEQEDVVSSGDDWWAHCGVGERGEQEAINDNQLNRSLEKEAGGTRSILRRGLLRRRSTSDKSRLLAYRNTGFLSSSQERKSESTPASRMTVSVDRPKYK